MIDKSAVMADDHYRLPALDQKILQPLDRFDVQMISRFVQKQHIRFLQQKLCQFDTHAPPPTELGGLPTKILSFEPQSQQGFLDISIIINLFDRIELLTQRRDALNKLHIFIRLIIRTRFQLLIDIINFRFHRMQMRESLRRFLKNRSPIFGHQMLRKVSYHGILRS